MDLTTLQAYRQEIYACFERAGDALFNTIDGLITESQAKSFPELSLSPSFSRSWSSLYKALKRGRLDRKSLLDIFLKYLPTIEAQKRLVLGLDATSIERPFSFTSPDRTVLPMHNIPHSSPKKATPLTFGWKYSTVVVLPDSPSSWTFILDQERIPSDKTDIQVALKQLKKIVPKLAKRALLRLGSRVCERVVVVSAHGPGHRCLGETEEQSMFLSASTRAYGKKRFSSFGWSEIEIG